MDIFTNCIENGLISVDYHKSTKLHYDIQIITYCFRSAYIILDVLPDEKEFCLTTRERNVVYGFTNENEKEIEMISNDTINIIKNIINDEDYLTDNIGDSLNN